VWCWIESVVGLPVAAYGLINHLLAWALLFWRGLLKKGSEPDEHRQWLIRTLMVLGCYVAQVMLCAHWLGRATAGYYVLTLPLSGAYMWRYWSLLRNRTRLLFLSARLPAEGAKLRWMREKLLEEINSERDAYAEALGIPH
jgi:hypothetical protein